MKEDIRYYEGFGKWSFSLLANNTPRYNKYPQEQLKPLFRQWQDMVPYQDSPFILHTAISGLTQLATLGWELTRSPHPIASHGQTTVVGIHSFILPLTFTIPMLPGADKESQKYDSRFK